MFILHFDTKIIEFGWVVIEKMQIKCWRVMTKISNFFEVATTHVKPQLSLVKRYCKHNHTSSANWDEKLRRHPSTVKRQALL